MSVTGEGVRRLGTWVFAVVGLILLVVAIRNAVETYDFIRGATRVEGKVVRLNAGGSHPQISFTAGKDELVTYPQGGMIFGFHAGDTVGVLFSPADPAGTATIDSAGALWFATAIPAGLAALLLFLALTLVRAG